jgi:hypothetical protein
MFYENYKAGDETYEQTSEGTHMKRNFISPSLSYSRFRQPMNLKKHDLALVKIIDKLGAYCDAA